MENYFSTYIERDVRRLFPALNLQVYERLVSMLARSSGEIVNASDFARSLGVSQPTVRSHLRIVEGTFLWRSVEAHHKSARRKMVKMPKGHLRDAGLINFLLGNRDAEEMLNHPHVGRIWEGFVGEELIKGLKNRLMRVEVSSYRTYHGTEIDYIS